jgi:hypothetical protein
MAQLIIPTDTSQATLGYLLADGTIVGSTSQAQDFGSNGITADKAVFNDRIGINQAVSSLSRLAITEDNAALTSTVFPIRTIVSPTLAGNIGLLTDMQIVGTIDTSGFNLTTLTGLQFAQGIKDTGGPVGTVTDWYFLRLGGNVPSAGPNVTTITGVEIAPTNLGNLGGTGTNVYGIRVKAIDANSSAGTVWGIRVEDQPTAGTAYGFYQDGTNALNIFNANVRVGSASDPTVALDVTGAAKISSTLTMAANILMANNSITNINTLEFQAGGDGSIIDGSAGFELKIINDNVAQGDPFSLEILRLQAGSGAGAAGANNDEGLISFWLDNSSGATAEFAQIKVVGIDVDGTSRDAAIEFDVMVADSLTKILTINGSGITVQGDATAQEVMLKVDQGAAVSKGDAASGMGWIVDYDGGKSAVLTSGTNNSSFQYDNSGGWTVNSNTAARILAGDSSSSSQKMIITSGGDMGLGESVPTARLHVFDTASTVAILEGSSHALVVIEGTGNNECSLNYHHSDAGGLKWKTGMDNTPIGFRPDFVIKQANNANPEFIITTDSLFGMSRDGLAADPLGQLHIEQTSTSAALPVLLLDQRDVSEEGIKFTLNAASPVDADINLFTVDVTGAPNLSWDESADDLIFSTGVQVESRDVNRYAYSVG